MNINQLLFDTAYKELLVMLQRNGLSEYDLKKYFVVDNRKPESLQDVYIEFIRTASTNYLPTASIINFNENQTKISEILQGFNYEYASLLSGTEKDKMSEKFIDLFNVQRGSDKEKDYLLTRWIKVVLFSAVFISGCRNIEGFYNRVNRIDDLKQVPIRISNEIEGFGFNSACDALTNLGYPEYVRPNWHLSEICTQLKIIKGKDYEAFDAMRRIADDNNISPFVLDKVFQLVCSGNLYKDNKSINVDNEKQRNNIIQGVERQIKVFDAPLTEYEDNKKQKQDNAVNSLIDSFDKLDISESAPEALNNEFEASINGEDIACIKEMCESNRNDLLIKLLRPFASENCDTDLVEAEGYINRIETLDDARIKVTFRITNDNMHKFNLLYLCSNFKRSKDGDYYIPLTFKEKAKHGHHLIDDLYYPFVYFYECIVSKDAAIKRKWLSETKETKYYKLEIKDLGSFFNKLNNKTDKNGRIIFYDEENVHGGRYMDVKEIAKPESCKGSTIKTNGFAKDYFYKLFDFYKEAKINIYRVGQGNCITARISYAHATKKTRLLVFDAGTKEEKFIESTAKLLKAKIETKKPHEVFFMLSHHHTDHHNILDSLFNLLKKDGTNKKIKMYCILPSKEGQIDFEPEELYGISFFRQRARKVDGGPGKRLHKYGYIKIFQGNSCPEGGWKDVNSQSIMIQLKNTLLPADSYYRFWPDDYGKDYRDGPYQYHKFKYIVAPHHGFYENKSDEDKDKFNAVFDVNDSESKLYITRDDEGYKAGEIDELLKFLGISNGVSDQDLVEITYTSDNNRSKLISFTDS